MAYKTSYELHHHFPRLAEESGFTFNTHRPRVHIDWNKIKLIDIENLIRERKFVVIEQHLNDILDCVFESEFDVRILDEGVLKMFRLAQLAVEYQQFCRHYLDRSVYVLREEITSLAQDLDATKKHLQEKEEELRKLKRRSRHSFKSPLPYGNDNIAAMILKTLSNKGQSSYPATSNADNLHYNKCSYCDKVFLNQLYLQSHIARRHAEVMGSPQKDKQEIIQNNENSKLGAEIMELKIKLKDMEQAISNSNNHNQSEMTQQKEKKTTRITDGSENVKTTRDAEVSTNTEEYLLNKFEQWKKEEHEKYNKEISALRTQILETVNSIKEKQTSQDEPKNNKVIGQLQNTIKQQEAEILMLKQELTNSKKDDNRVQLENNKETEKQIAFWTKRAEIQSKQYDALLQKLNEVAKDAKESRALAETEKEKVAHLQNLLEQSHRATAAVQTSTEDHVMINSVNHKPSQVVKASTSKNLVNKPKIIADRHTLDNLHKKAQELLNIGSLSSTLSDSSNIEEEIPTIPKNCSRSVNIIKQDNDNSKIKVINSKSNKVDPPVPKPRNHVPESTKTSSKMNKNKVSNVKKPKVKAQDSQNKAVLKTQDVPAISGSPIRIVRAKLNEEVNNRLSFYGVDPLKSRLPQTVFQKQRTELQQMHEMKTKKNPTYEKIKYSILAYLDSNVSTSHENNNGLLEHVSPNKTNHTLRSLTSVISNVKSKALSLVKLNDNNAKEKRKSLDVDVAKRAMTLLKTPPGSAPESPMRSKTLLKKNVFEIKNDNTQKSYKTKNNNSHEMKSDKNKHKTNSINKQSKDAKVSTFESEDESTESDHKYYSTAIVSDTAKSIENLIKSPARRPTSADNILDSGVRKDTAEDDLLTRSQSVSNLRETRVEVNNIGHEIKKVKNESNSSDDIESLSDSPIKKTHSDENISNLKQTRGVLKSASSMSSLNKKKVLFDMDAIQMKSVSASPSQSITEKSEGNENYELGLVNLDGEEWDISSIDNEPLKNDTKIQINARTSPKIAELKQTIENQLARRIENPNAVVGGVDILTGPIARVPSIGGSNTSLGSSILDESDGIPAVNHKAFAKAKKVADKDDSELDLSEFSIDGIVRKNESF